MNYAATLVTSLSINVILACSLHLIYGMGGLLFVAQFALMGVGAYTAAILSVSSGMPILLAILIGMVAAAAVGAGFGAVSTRLKGYEYVLVTFVFQMIMTEILGTAEFITNGSLGIYGVERPALPWDGFVNSTVSFAILALLIALVTVVITQKLTISSFGLAVRALREGEPSTMALGISTPALRVLMLAIGGAGTGLAGGLFASQIGVIYPVNFTVELSILVIVYIVVGGKGNVWGAILGVAVVMAIPQVLGAFNVIPPSLQGPVNQMAYGLVIMLFVWFRPKGIIPERPSLRMHPKSGKKRIGSGDTAAPNNAGIAGGS